MMATTRTGSELIPHLFRTEFSRIVSVLCKSFGLAHIETAEDIASETFLAAMESWPYRGIPENPKAWLYTVAQNKARNVLAHSNVFNGKVTRELSQQRSGSGEAVVEIDLSEGNITDSQLQMLFAICHPSMPTESQVGLALRILCGFGIDEIATAFLTNRETINKRLFRAREKLREENIQISFPSKEALSHRLDNVLTTLYLLFSEGYYSESNSQIIREELCIEAMRLTQLLLGSGQTNKPRVNALLALMCFHASRFKARRNSTGNLILYDDQDESLWDTALIARGAECLHKASTGDELSKYHLEAQIAYWHTVKSDSVEKWESILQLYNRLLMLEYSPVVALNRTYALYKVKGRHVAIQEAEKLNLIGNRYYYVLLGELYSMVDAARAQSNFREALNLSVTDEEKRIINERLESVQMLSIGKA